VEQAEQTATGESALESAGERRGERLAHRRAREIDENAVGETLELQLAGIDEASSRRISGRSGRRRATSRKPARRKVDATP
jgi:endonuclease V-like protein UPF0215 family